MTERLQPEGDRLKKVYEGFANPANRAGLVRIAEHVLSSKSELNSVKKTGKAPLVRGQIIDEILTGRLREGVMPRSIVHSGRKVSAMVEYLTVVARLHFEVDEKRVEFLQRKKAKIETENLKNDNILPLTDVRLVFEGLVQRLTVNGLPTANQTVKSNHQS